MSKDNNQEVFHKTNINWYPGHMAKTKREIKERINLIDVIYEVIDARMPNSSKMKDMEDILRNKPRIIIMTKKDLCDLSVTKKWIKKYEDDGYNVVLMDLTNNNDYKVLINLTKELMEPLNKKRRENGLKDKEIRIGVIGVPNVGKSTLINKLAGRKVASVGNRPGVTKQVNWLRTNHGFLLLDTPGILWPNLGDSDEALSLAATATIRAEILNITDIGVFLVNFYKNNYPDILVEKYKITLKNRFDEMLDQLAEKYKFYTDGYADYEKVSQKLYNDVVSGTIKGVTFDVYR